VEEIGRPRAPRHSAPARQQFFVNSVDEGSSHDSGTSTFAHVRYDQGDAMKQEGTTRFVQIAVAMAPQQANLIYALDDAGGVWFYRDTKKKWVRVPDDRE